MKRTWAEAAEPQPTITIKASSSAHHGWILSLLGLPCPVDEWAFSHAEARARAISNAKFMRRYRTALLRIATSFDLETEDLAHDVPDAVDRLLATKYELEAMVRT